MFNRASAWGFVPEDRSNPARGIERFKEVSRDRWLKPEEVTRRIEAVRNHVPGQLAAGNGGRNLGERKLLNESAGAIKDGKTAPARHAKPDPDFRAFVPLLLLTGLRENELLRARWDDVNLKRGEIRLTRTKSGRPQTRKLSAPAIEILRFLPREENPHVFPGRSKGTHRRDFRNEWQEVREAAGPEDVTLHDLRRTAGSYMAQAGCLYRRSERSSGISIRRLPGCTPVSRRRTRRRRWRPWARSWGGSSSRPRVRVGK
jgi:integrase